MENRWTTKSLPNTELISQLSENLKISNSISAILLQREIDNKEKAQAFFRPQLSELHDPFLMKDMDTAIKRIKSAINSQEKMMVYGDYDVDGTTAVSIVFSYFQTLNQNIEYYIPHRYKEGYGISKLGIDYAKEQGITLIIALDCGIRSVELIDYANSLGIEFIICDHHLPGDQIPAAAAVLNPKQIDCPYPYKELSGAGIGFKLIQAYSKKEGFDEDKVMEYIDLVAVSIAADLVDMRGENRILAFYGIKKLNENPSIGLQSLMPSNQRKVSYSVQDIVFGIGPKINAAGRVSDAKAAVSVLIERDYTKAVQLTRVLNDQNDERKELDTDITRTAIEMVDNDPILQSKKSLVIMGKEWHKGVIGIVASRMVEQYYKPTIIFSLNDGILTGSARSVKNFDIHEAISLCSEWVEQFGGHKYAAGLSIKEENFEIFCEKFEEIVINNIAQSSLSPEIEYDLEINLEEITPEFVKIINRMAPFGPGNPMPVFMSSGLRSSNSVRVLKDKHLKLQVSQGGPFYDSIGFGLCEHLPTVSNGNEFSACYCVEENHFNGITKLQLRIKDFK